jgi:hypothetical protein
MIPGAYLQSSQELQHPMEGDQDPTHGKSYQFQ